MLDAVASTMRAMVTLSHSRSLAAVGARGPPLRPCCSASTAPAAADAFQPFTLLGSDLTSHIFSFLTSVRDLEMAGLVCRDFRRIASSDDAGWRRHCEVGAAPPLIQSLRCILRVHHVFPTLRLCLPPDLQPTDCTDRVSPSLTPPLLLLHARTQEAWADKVYMPAAIRHGDLPYRERYRLAAADAQRSVITLEELCTFRWTFHFKPEAGEFWLALDPYWNQQPGGGAALERMFQMDGSIKAPPNDALWGECVAERRRRVAGRRRGGVVAVFCSILRSTLSKWMNLIGAPPVAACREPRESLALLQDLRWCQGFLPQGGWAHWCGGADKWEGGGVERGAGQGSSTRGAAAATGRLPRGRSRVAWPSSSRRPSSLGAPRAGEALALPELQPHQQLGLDDTEPLGRVLGHPGAQRALQWRHPGRSAEAPDLTCC